MGWWVTRSRARFSAGLTLKAGADRTIRSGSGREARLRSGASGWNHMPASASETTCSRVRYLRPTTQLEEIQPRRSQPSRVSRFSTAT